MTRYQVQSQKLLSNLPMSTNQKPPKPAPAAHIQNSFFKKVSRAPPLEMVHPKSHFEKSTRQPKDAHLMNQLSKSSHHRVRPGDSNLYKQKSLSILKTVDPLRGSSQEQSLGRPVLSGETSDLSKKGHQMRVTTKHIKTGKNHKSEKSLFKSCYFDDKQIGSKLKSFSKTVRKSDVEVSDADYNYLLKSPNDHLSSVGFEVVAPNDYDLTSNEVQKRRQTFDSVQINEFSANAGKPRVGKTGKALEQPGRPKPGKNAQFLSSSKDTNSGPKGKKDGQRLPPILNKSINAVMREKLSQSKEDVFEYSGEESDGKETDKKGGSFQTNVNRQSTNLEKSQAELSSTLKNQHSLDSGLPIGKMLREVDLKRPASFVVEKDLEDHLISFNLDNINEFEYEKLLSFMLKYHRRKVARQQGKGRMRDSQGPRPETPGGKNRDHMRTEVDALVGQVKTIKAQKHEMMEQARTQSQEIAILKKQLEQLQKKHQENQRLCSREIELLMEENALFRDHFENVIRQVLEFSDKMAQRKVENSNESHVKIIGELVENINLMIRKISKDFNAKLGKVKKTFHLKIRDLEEANLDLERENKYLRKDLEMVRQSTSREQLAALVEAQVSTAMAAYKDKMNSKLNYMSERFSHKLKRLRQEPFSTKPLPPFKMPSVKAKASNKGSSSYRHIELDTLEGFQCSPGRDKASEGKSIKFLKKLFDKERPFRLQENARRGGNERSKQTNLDLINKKIRRSYRNKKNHTQLEFDIKKYQSSQPDNYIEESRFVYQPSKSPFSKTDRKDLPGSSRLGYKNNFMNEFNKITKKTKTHLKKQSFQIPSAYKPDAKHKIKKLRLVDKSSHLDL